MKKKLVTMLLCASCVLSVAACGSTSSQSSSAASSTTTKVESQETQQTAEESQENDVPTVRDASQIDTAAEATSRAIASAVEKSDGVTMDQFNQIKEGMTLSEVQDIFGSEGTKTSSAASGDNSIEIYIWTGDDPGSSASISFTNGKVSATAQAGLK